MSMIVGKLYRHRIAPPGLGIFEPSARQRGAVCLREKNGADARRRRWMYGRGGVLGETGPGSMARISILFLLLVPG